jgi:hypothetical protein
VVRIHRWYKFYRCYADQSVDHAQGLIDFHEKEDFQLKSSWCARFFCKDVFVSGTVLQVKKKLAPHHLL